MDLIVKFSKEIHIIWWYVFAMSLYGFGEYISKVWANTQVHWLVPVIVLCYALDSVFWLAIIVSRNELALMSCIWQVLATLVSTGVAVLIFREKLTTYQCVGIVACITGMVLLVKDMK